MLAQKTTDLLHRLKLPAMAEALDEQRRMPDVVSLDFEDRLALLLEREQFARENRRLTRLLQLARLRHAASIEDVNFRVKRGLDKSQLLRLATGDWIQQHGVLLMTGPPGVGKTHLSVALGLEACRMGLRVTFTTAAALITTLGKAVYENRLEERLKILTQPKLLIIDEIGYIPIDRQGANLFFQLVSRRYERGAILLTSNQSLSAWGEVFGDTVIASAILDRLLHHATTINIKGDSYRLREKRKAGLIRSTITPTDEA